MKTQYLSDVKVNMTDSIWVVEVEDDIFSEKTVLIVCLAVLGCKQLSANCSKHIESYFAEVYCISC